MTRRERALSAIIDDLLQRVEELGCTCVDADERNRLHAANRRRRDSRCAGVAAATDADLRRRRALTILN